MAAAPGPRCGWCHEPPAGPDKRRWLFRGHDPQLLGRGQDRQSLDRPGGLAIDPDKRLTDEGNAIELTVELGLEDVPRRQMYRRAIVPERNIALVPLEAHGIFRAGDVFPEDFENFLAFARGQP